MKSDTVPDVSNVTVPGRAQNHRKTRQESVSMRQERIEFGGLVSDAGLRRMSRAGMLILGIGALLMLSCGLMWPEPYAKGIWLVVDLLAIGRAVCAYEGIRMGFTGLYLFLQGGAQDIGYCLVVFPFIARFYERIARDRAIDQILGYIIRSAEKHTVRLQRFGAAGLFVFVFFPVAGTGTLVGTVVGYLLGIPVRLALPVVIAAHLLSLAFLLTFFDWLEPMLRTSHAGFAQYFAWIVLASILVLGGCYRVVKSFLAHRSGKRNTMPAFNETTKTPDE